MTDDNRELEEIIEQQYAKRFDPMREDIIQFLRDHGVPEEIPPEIWEQIKDKKLPPPRYMKDS